MAIDAFARSLAASAKKTNSSGGSSTTSYSGLTEKPTINGVELSGDHTSLSLNIVNDNNVSTTSTYSSQQIEMKIGSLSGVKEIVGTEDAPIIASNLDIGVYIMSGVIQSSLVNMSTINVPRKVYCVYTENDTTIIWDENPLASMRYNVVFKHNGTVSPIESSVKMVTEEYLKSYIESMTLDCGVYE